MLVWTAYSRREKRVVAYEVSNEGISSCLRIYNKVKEKTNKVLNFYSDGNSCYRATFDRYMPQEKLTITKKPDAFNRKQ
jgi:IS1 family transposase